MIILNYTMFHLFHRFQNIIFDNTLQKKCALKINLFTLIIIYLKNIGHILIVLLTVHLKSKEAGSEKIKPYNFNLLCNLTSEEFYILYTGWPDQYDHSIKL